MSSFCILAIGLLTFKSIYIVGLFPPLLLLCSQHSYGRGFKHIFFGKQNLDKEGSNIEIACERDI